MEGVIEASTRVQATFEHVQELLLTDPKVVLGDGGPASEEGDEVRSAVAVEVNTAPGLQEEVLVELLLGVAPARVNHTKVSVPLRWEAVGLSRRFPTFNGTLDVTRSQPGSTVCLRGVYVLPLDPVGQFGDGVAGRRLARQAGAALLERIARTIDGGELSRPDLAMWHPGAHAVTLAELLASEERVNRQ